MGLLATVLACLAMSPGCGGPAVEAPPAVAGFALSYQRSGGLAASPRSLVIKPGRHGTAKGLSQDGSVGSVDFRVGVKQIEKLRTALERADFQSIASEPSPGACADCYFYSIEYRGHATAFSEVDMPTQLSAVVARVEALIEAHLPFH